MTFQAMILNVTWGIHRKADALTARLIPGDSSAPWDLSSHKSGCHINAHLSMVQDRPLSVLASMRDVSYF